MVDGSNNNNLLLFSYYLIRIPLLAIYVQLKTCTTPHHTTHICTLGLIVPDKAVRGVIKADMVVGPVNGAVQYGHNIVIRSAAVCTYV